MTFKSKLFLPFNLPSGPRKCCRDANVRVVFFDMSVFLGKYGRGRTNYSTEISKKRGIYQLQGNDGIVGIMSEFFFTKRSKRMLPNVLHKSAVFAFFAFELKR